MAKSISFKNVKPASAIDEFVASHREGETPPARSPNGEQMKRFTIDVPRALHTRIKTECARRGVKMADMMRELLERQFP